MKFQVTSEMIQFAEAHVSGKGSTCGNKDFEEYLDYIMQRNALPKTTDCKKALEVYFQLIMLAEVQ